jgi:hypothetical protein
MKTHLVMFNYERQACGVDDSDVVSKDTAHGLNLLGMRIIHGLPLILVVTNVTFITRHIQVIGFCTIGSLGAHPR